MSDAIPYDFEALRPYHDEEVPEVLTRISQRPSFGPLMSYLYPEVSLHEISHRFCKVRSVEEFQHTYISQAVNSMIRDSITALTHEGLADLEPTRGYLFLSNHRDIILDSALLNVLRYEAKQPTTYIAIGDNLMISPMVTDLMKLNKAFLVHRHPPRALMYHYSARLSHYMLELIAHQQNSVWLAQRNGRTKNGKDQTQPSLLKMLCIAAQDHDRMAHVLRLNVLPMAISYEYEPCDYLKAQEMVHHEAGIPYEKDDKTAIIRGIREPKGRVHLAVGTPLNQADLEALKHIHNRNEWFRHLAELIDAQISKLYHRWPNQYVAHDLLHQSHRWHSRYQSEERAAFVDYVERRINGQPGDTESLRRMMYRIYAGMIE